MEGMSTLCYIEKDGKWLMLHRTVKKHDVNHDKWIGVGGHFEKDESPEECLLREVREETGYTLTSWRFRGIVTFVSGGGVTEYMHLFTADGFTGDPIPCDEGELEWVDKSDVPALNLWEGDRIFFRLLAEDRPFFSLKLVYDGAGTLTSAVLDGKELELLQVLDEDGHPTGILRDRVLCHQMGSPHATVHIWVARPGKEGRIEVLLQKRSRNKDSNPGALDTSTAGHIDGFDRPAESAVRELSEELGIHVSEKDLIFLGSHREADESIFHGKIFRDRQLIYVYLYQGPVDTDRLVLQKEEVERVFWYPLDQAKAALEARDRRVLGEGGGEKGPTGFLPSERSREEDPVRGEIWSKGMFASELTLVEKAFRRQSGCF